jgi:hypothetical protein
MTMPPGEGDRTVPAPSSDRAGAGGEPTVPAGDGQPPAGGPPPGGEGGGGPSERRDLLLLSGSTVGGLVVGALIALVVGNGGTGSTTATTASSTTSTSTTTTSSTTTTTTPAAPQILSFAASPTNPTCLASGSVQLSWSSQNAVSVAITDNGSSIGTFPPTGARTVAFHCPPMSHTYVLTVTSTGGRQASRDLTVTGTVPPSSTAASSTTTTT